MARARQDGKYNNYFLHGGSGTPEHQAWQAMQWRCNNPNLIDWPRYGGRGIKVCARWVASFQDFLTDMGRRPSPSHSLDRFPDKNGDYEPGNCRWATPRQQQNNMRTNRIVKYHGQDMTFSEAVRISEAGVTRRMAQYRLGLGWSVDQAMDTPRIRTARGGKTYASLGIGPPA